MKKKIYEFICSVQWWLINTFICNLPGGGIRKSLLKLNGMKIGSKVHIYEGFHIRSPRKIVIEDGVSIGPKVLLDGRKGLTIKKNATIAYEAIIWTLNHDYNDEFFMGKGASVRIGEYAWVCSRAIILPGITVGKGAVIASNAVVTKDVPDYAIVAGIPAKIIGWRENKNYKYGV